MIRITLDTNELVSAFNFGGKAMKVFHQAADGELEIAISEPIIKETLRVLREKFSWQPYRLHALGEELTSLCIVVEPKETLAVLADEPDNRILECAKEANSEIIISEDRPMLRLKWFGAIEIMNLRDFLARREA